jgi:SWI/SNF-related matrix-associated actin-dependent regulator 1 of chromatin subfamily A
MVVLIPHYGVARNVPASYATDAPEIDIPGLGGTLKPFQRAGVAYALKARRCLIADEMGLGKTVQALATLQAANAFPAVAVCPASLKLNWQRETRKWLPMRDCRILGKDAESDIRSADVLILNYDILHKHLPALLARGLQAVILDESHYVKNFKSQRTQACIELSQQIPIRLALTGTPLLNRPVELASQLFILGHLVRKFGGWRKFTNRYCDPYYGYGGHLDLSGASNTQELAVLLRDICMIRREKADVLDQLPAKRRVIQFFDISGRGDYDRAERDVFSGAGLPPLPEVERLKQIAARGKMKAAIEWVENLLASGEKLVLFAHHIEIQQSLLAHFPDAAHILGEDSPEERQANVDRFQTDAACNLIVCSLSVGGVGFNLQAASNVAFLELGWNPATHEQAEDRLHRIGQNRSVTAYYLLASGTIDEEIQAMIESKRAVVNSVTGKPDARALADLALMVRARRMS